MRALLALNYHSLELVVINDGSRDNTLAELHRAFKLRTARVLYLPTIPSAPVHEIYTSALDPRLIVIDKDSAGSKADAVNAGLNVATSPYVCVVDADSILEKDSLLRIMASVFSDPQRVVAAGGIVRVLNGCQVSKGELRRVKLPRGSLEVMQVVEYLRAFLIGREAWAHLMRCPLFQEHLASFRPTWCVR